jgi:GTP-binding protein HflX
VLHLRDIADPDTAAQAEDVERILGDLGVDASDAKHVIEVWNKVDLLDEANRARLIDEGTDSAKGPPIAISADEGRLLQGSVEADSTALVADKLRALGYVPVAIEQRHESGLNRNGDVVRRARRR